MPIMPWSDDFVLGIKQIDEQHRWLVDNINALYDESSKNTPDQSVIGEILEGLVDYTFNHFIVEEEIFQRHDYPQTGAHKDEHNKFNQRIAEVLERYENTGKLDSSVMVFLKDWLSHHILTVDKAYVPFFKSKGVE